MTFKVKSKKPRMKKVGRPRVDYKIRSIRGLTPRGFKYLEHKKGKLIFKKKKK